MVTAASPCQTLASSYEIFGRAYFFYGPPNTSSDVGFFHDVNPVLVNDRIDYTASTAVDPIMGYEARVFTYGANGFARLSLTSRMRHDVARVGPGSDTFLSMRAAGSVQVVINDLIITGPGTGAISTSANLHLDGSMSATSGAFAAGLSNAGGAVSTLSVSAVLNSTSVIGQGQFMLTSEDGTPSSSESGWLSGFDGDAVLTTDSFSAQLDTPFTIAFTIGGSAFTSISDNTGGLADALLRFDNTLSFNTEGDVFNLPPGYTANSVSAGIVNNRFVVVPEPSTVALLAGAAVFGVLKSFGRRRRTGSS